MLGNPNNGNNVKVDIYFENVNFSEREKEFAGNIQILWQSCNIRHKKWNNTTTLPFLTNIKCKSMKCKTKEKKYKCKTKEIQKYEMQKYELHKYKIQK